MHHPRCERVDYAPHMPVAILWHLHQPDYRHPRTHQPVMPWVRLHALRGYRDLPLEVLEHGAAMTINIVPSLVDQLLGYGDGATDRHLELTRRDADTLEPAEVREICDTFIVGNEAMIDSRPAYRRLRSCVAGTARLTPGQVRDLQVWSTLAWFGHTAVRDFPELTTLFDKGEHFSEADKATMLAVQDRILVEVPELFGRIANSAHAELSTSPYFHPILPLLVDARHARRCLPDLPEDVDFAWPEDARWQLLSARERMRELYGTAPVGLWPSEGSVSPEVARLAAEAGYAWLASDEEVLQRSSTDDGEGSGPWELPGGIRGLFRNRELSDFIGFSAARLPAAEAAEQLIAGLRHAGAEDELVMLTLDGENPWEAFPDAGGAFRAALFAGLARGPVRAVTCATGAGHEPVGRVRTLHTGSWIHADFTIWIGHAEDRAGWRLLADARRAAERIGGAARDEALRYLHAAEGSDWFWWYGEEFSTPFASWFDALFRAWVRAAWQALGEEPPIALDEPIKQGPVQRLARPVKPIDPGLQADAPWIRWAGAGAIRWPAGSAMSLGGRHLGRSWYGWSSRGDRLWLRVELPDPLPAVEEGSWRLSAGGALLELPYGEVGACTRSPAGAAVHGNTDLVACVEVSALEPGDVPIWVSVLSRGLEIARYPAHGRLELPAPEGDPGLSLWTV